MSHSPIKFWFFFLILICFQWGTCESVLPLAIPSPARFFHLDLASDFARIEKNPQICFCLRTANLWNHASLFINANGERFSYSGDGEIIDAHFQIRFPLGKQLELQGELNAFYLYAGWMDEGIQNWHRLFNIRSHDRENFLPNQEKIETGSLRWTSPGLVIEKIALRFKWNWVSEKTFALSVRGDVSLPLGDDAHHLVFAPEGGLSLIGSFEPSRWFHLHSTLGVLLLHQDPSVSLATGNWRTQIGFDVGFWLFPSEQFAFVLGHKLTGAMYDRASWKYVPRTGSSASENEQISSGQAALFEDNKWIYLGAQWRLSAHLDLSLFLLEDLWIKDWSKLKFEGNDAPDLLLGLGLTWRFV
jgi:hypothetical protein